MRHFIFFAAATIVALAITGCAGVNRAQMYADQGLYMANPTRSRALNVAVATGLTECDGDKCSPLHDVPRSKLPLSLRAVDNSQIADSLSAAWGVGYGVGQIQGMVSAFTGFSNLASGLLSISDALLGPTTMKDPALVPTIIAWMPQSMTKTPRMAREAIIETVAESLPRGEFSGREVRVKLEKAHNRMWVSFKGDGDCNDDVTCSLFVGFSEPAETDVGPSWATAGPAYVWLNWGRGQKSDGSFHNIQLDIVHYNTERGERELWPSDLNARAYLMQVSANLPKWVYIYLPPTKAHPYPVMLNQGEQLLFVEPL